MRTPTIQNWKDFFREFVPYWITFAAGIGIGLLITCLCVIPIRFLRITNEYLIHFVIGTIFTIIPMFRRSWRKGYHTNCYTYSFDIKKSLLYIVAVLIIQIIFALLLSPTVYIAGPTAWLSDYFTSAAVVSGKYAVYIHDWILMLAADIFIYCPCMILGEYWGSKKNKKAEGTIC